MPSTTRPLRPSRLSTEPTGSGRAGPSSGNGPAVQASAVGSGRERHRLAWLLDGGAAAPLEQERRIVVDRSGEDVGERDHVLAGAAAVGVRAGARAAHGPCPAGSAARPSRPSSRARAEATARVRPRPPRRACVRGASRSPPPRHAGGTGSAAMLTRVLGAARADHERRDLAGDDPRRCARARCARGSARARRAARPRRGRRTLRPSAPTARGRCGRRRRWRRSGVPR